MAKTAVIHQGAGALGLSLAQRFGQDGAQVIVTGRELSGWTAAQTTGLAVRLETIGSGDAAQYAAQYAALVGRLGTIDVWINQATAGRGGPAEALAAEDWDAQLAEGLSSAFLGAQAAARVMLAQGRGVIVNLAYENGRKPVEGRVASNVVNAGLMALTESLGIEWARRGVRVVGVALPPEGADGNLARLPMRRLGTPEEIAETVAFLASDEAGYITAETLRVDGGWGAYQLF